MVEALHPHPMLAYVTALHALLGLVPLRSWRSRFGAPIALDGYGPGAADNPAVALEAADRMRDTVQAGVWKLL